MFLVLFLEFLPISCKLFRLRNFLITISVINLLIHSIKKAAKHTLPLRIIRSLLFCFSYFCDYTTQMIQFWNFIGNLSHMNHLDSAENPDLKHERSLVIHPTSPRLTLRILTAQKMVPMALYCMPTSTAMDQAISATNWTAMP